MFWLVCKCVFIALWSTCLHSLVKTSTKFVKILKQVKTLDRVSGFHWSDLEFSQTFASVFTRQWRHREHVLFFKYFAFNNYVFIYTSSHSLYHVAEHLSLLTSKVVRHIAIVRDLQFSGFGLLGKVSREMGHSVVVLPQPSHSSLQKVNSQILTKGLRMYSISQSMIHFPCCSIPATGYILLLNL